MDSLQTKYAKAKDEKAIEKVVTGEVKRKKRSKSRRVLDLFINEDGADIKEYLISEVVIPGIKNTILDIMNLLFWGRTQPKKGGGYTPYNSISSGSRGSSRKPVRAGYIFDDVIVETREEAKDALSMLNEIIDRYGEASVGDFYEIVGITSNGFTDRQYGWRDIRDAYIRGTREGYLIHLPRCEELN